MVLYTVDDTFELVDTIDAFDSAIWTERFYGDGDFQLDVPATPDMMAKLQPGTVLLCDGSIQPMILETRDTQAGIMKTTGITLTQWLNNRIIRTTNDHTVREWLLNGYQPGYAIVQIVQNFCMNSSYLNGTINIGIPSYVTSDLPIIGLQIGAIDTSGSTASFSVPFGPVYDACKQIATAYGVGMKIEFDGASGGSDFILQFITYKGDDRTSGQSINPTIRFSPEMDTFTNAHDLESISDYKNYVYIFAPNAPTALLGAPGFWVDGGPPPTGFKLRIFQNYNEDIQSDFTGSAAQLLSALNQRAALEGFNHRAQTLVDGEIVQTGQIQYGVDYFLGDFVEVEGNSGVLQTAQITEYIRSQDATGERAYPTLATS